VAELASAFLCAEFGFNKEQRHASYIANWIELLRHDNRAFMTAASKASRRRIIFADWQSLTRSVTRILDGNQEICRIYRQYDGYPTGMFAPPLPPVSWFPKHSAGAGLGISRRTLQPQ
jgi:Zincin-like metallopeptidase